ncbi:autotransporter outer membrane beta-barrel domain-containing protein [Succinispira mobilis]|uniref:autotransporter outer membrane beta-barrel domain-containing protein n=1 Tax=Succinispira mobilis TaxID=78120 RepID=UPI000362E370|nr:autotransporter outer membrane beta-barrel domain-containing protein [Succinispira mobilis]
MTKKQKAQLLSALLLSTNLLCPSITQAALYDGGTYNEDITLTEEMGVGAYANNIPVNINGNLKITAPIALFVSGTSAAVRGILKINMNKNKTVQLEGDIFGSGAGTLGEVYVNFANSDSYLAGLVNDGFSVANIAFSNGATWYVSEDAGIWNTTVSGANINLWQTKPNTIRGTDAGDRTTTLGKTDGMVEGKLNGANFVLSSDIENNAADKVILKGVTGSNTYTVQIAYDPALEKGNATYLPATAPVVLKTEDSSGSYTALPKTYKTTRPAAMGLTTEDIQLTPQLTTAAGETKLTGLLVEKATTGEGPAAVMAGAAASAQMSALSAWRAENNDLQRRMGDLRWDEGEAGAWVRAYGGESEIKGSSAATASYHGLQAGYDRAHKLATGKLFTGLAISKMKSDVSGSGGSSDLDSNLVGIYGSYVGERGHFVDAIVKYGRIANSSIHHQDGVSYAGDYATRGLNMSLEYGYRQQLAKDFYLEPQVELNYNRVNSSSYTMTADGTAGAQVQNQGLDSLIGRLGINAGHKTEKGNVYLKLSCLHEFKGDTNMTANYNGTTVQKQTSGSDTWLEYGLGFDQRLAKNQNLYGEITRAAFADKISDKWKANLGWRMSF